MLAATLHLVMERGVFLLFNASESPTAKFSNFFFLLKLHGLFSFRNQTAIIEAKHY